MDDSEFPKPVDDVVATLADIYRHQHRQEMVELLESANARIEYIEFDNWDGGTYIHDLKLDIPVSVFAAIESTLTEIEKDISSKLRPICRNLSNHHLGSVTIAPLTSKATSVGPKAKPAEAELEHIWKGGFFRLFVSHVSAHKVAVGKLKTALYLRGVSAFVAHEDITPSKVWQDEIELALRSMHALAALLTPDFHQSNWTDQEVGFALGKGVLVVPVRLGFDPYGFIGKVQGLSGFLDRPARVADDVTSILLDHSTTRREMRKALVAAFASTSSITNAIELGKIIESAGDFSKEEKTMLHRACKENDQVFKATGLVAQICAAIGVPVPKKATTLVNDDAPPF